MKKLILLASAALLATSTLADDISLGTPGYGGTGCPEGTVSATLSPDKKSLSLLFDQYQVAVGGTSGKSFDRKSCNIAIPVHVPQGLSVSILQIDFRGFNHLPQQATSQFNVEYFFAGTRRLPDQQRTHGSGTCLVGLRGGRQSAHQFEHAGEHRCEQRSHGLD
jgi:hypothetical protein